jgi:hypothetical protein
MWSFSVQKLHGFIAVSDAMHRCGTSTLLNGYAEEIGGCIIVIDLQDYLLVRVWHRSYSLRFFAAFIFAAAFFDRTWALRRLRSWR